MSITSPDLNPAGLGVPIAPEYPASAQLLPAEAPAPRHPRPALLYLAVTLMVLSWTVNLPVGKVALRSFPPLLLISFRTILAALLILPVYCAANPSSRRIERSDIPGLILVCLFGQIGNQVFFVTGLNNTSISHTAFIVSLAPILILLLAAWVGQEQITARKLLGMLLSATGVVLLSFDKTGGGGPTLFGDLMDFGSACAFSMFTVLGKQYRTRYGPVTVNTFAYISGTFTLLPVVAYFTLVKGFQFGEVAPVGWTALLYMAVFPGVIGYLIYYYALGFIAASRLSMFNYLQAPLATALGVLFLGESLTPMLLVSGTLILGGVAFTERR